METAQSLLKLSLLIHFLLRVSTLLGQQHPRPLTTTEALKMLIFTQLMLLLVLLDGLNLGEELGLRKALP